MANIKAQIEKILAEVRPGIHMDGGDVELQSFKEGIVELKIKGACHGCPMAAMTFGLGVGEMIKQKIPQVKKAKYE